MPAFAASAPGKIILLGEHAVVYGQPAIAVPVTQVQAKAVVTPDLAGEPGVIQISSTDMGIHSALNDLPPGDPILETINLVLRTLDVKRMPSCHIKISSTIPIAAGLGSGAAISVAVIRALSGFLGHPMPAETVSKLAFEIEKIHHGTPSGIDNTVVTHAKPVYFVKDHTMELINIELPFVIVIGDTGMRSPTRETVGDVREGWQSDPSEYQRLFAAIGSITKTARLVIEKGHPERLGPLMDENHELLGEMGVSSDILDHLVSAAKGAGALGAKLSGGGRGGNMIALVKPSKAEAVAESLSASGAVNTITTTIQNPTQKA
jgi:mevalonate kinase